MGPADNIDYAQTLTVNPLHIMEDDELLSRFKLEDNTTGKFKEYRQELLYRLRKSHLESWTPPQRLGTAAAYPDSEGARND
jgi:hypothetical protein